MTHPARSVRGWSRYVAASAVIALVALALIRVPAGTVTEPSDVA